ncbi:hypothetical protein IGI04_015224 [Brassica rapa subsp. trilocularis]|uniref:Uncharacterized protein n=1 Tax=Brassica rapa subsp. trilocularis TaxID=1813537 RepID=A0ABQ7MPJ3_BRACM|nr:hypothetical protein IGI04_015224 [Brassica rapa subsp. trilocularis]
MSLCIYPTSESELGFRLIRFWETISTAKGGLLIGLDLLLTGKQKWLCTTRNLPHQYHNKITSITSSPVCASLFGFQIHRIGHQTLPSSH